MAISLSPRKEQSSADSEDTIRKKLAALRKLLDIESEKYERLYSSTDTESSQSASFNSEALILNPDTASSQSASSISEALIPNPDTEPSRSASSNSEALIPNPDTEPSQSASSNSEALIPDPESKILTTRSLKSKDNLKTSELSKVSRPTALPRATRSTTLSRTSKLPETSKLTEQRKLSKPNLSLTSQCSMPSPVVPKSTKPSPVVSKSTKSSPVVPKSVKQSPVVSSSGNLPPATTKPSNIGYTLGRRQSLPGIQKSTAPLTPKTASSAKQKLTMSLTPKSSALVSTKSATLGTAEMSSTPKSARTITLRSASTLKTDLPVGTPKSVETATTVKSAEPLDVLKCAAALQKVESINDLVKSKLNKFSTARFECTTPIMENLNKVKEYMDVCDCLGHYHPAHYKLRTNNWRPDVFSDWYYLLNVWYAVKYAVNFLLEKIYLFADSKQGAEVKLEQFSDYLKHLFHAFEQVFYLRQLLALGINHFRPFCLYFDDYDFVLHVMSIKEDLSNLFQKLDNERMQTMQFGYGLALMK